MAIVGALDGLNKAPYNGVIIWQRFLGTICDLHL